MEKNVIEQEVSLKN